MKHRFLFLIVAGSWTLPGLTARANDPALPGEGFAAARYETLWTKSPFAVAAAEATQGSSDYTLKGIVQVDGVSYASLIDLNDQGGAHFLVSSDKPARGLTLVSVTLGHDPSGTMAVVQKDGQWITLKLDTTAPVAANPPPNSISMPGGNLPIFMPGNGTSGVPDANTGQIMPPRRYRPHLVHLPPLPQQQSPSP